MKQFVGIVCIVLMLTLLLVGCGRKSNVSDNTEGRITEDTRPTTTERITTEATTTTVTTEMTTVDPTDTSESEVPDETDGIEGRLRRGIMGNERY